MNKLISNWKNTMQKQKSAKKAQKLENNENESAKKSFAQQQKKLISDFSSSSSDEELFETNFKNRNRRFQESNKKQSQALEDITNIQSSQQFTLDDPIQQIHETNTKDIEIDQEIKEAFQIKNEIRSQLPPTIKPPNMNKRKSISSYSVTMDECIFKILDIFNYKSNISLAEKKNSIKTILEQFMSQQQPIGVQNQNQDEQTNSTYTWKQQLNASKIENSKIVSEIENKLFESEKEKILLKQTKNSLEEKCEILSRELKSKELNMELVSLLKQNVVTLESTNRELLNEIQRYKQKDSVQQELFNQQINEFAIMYEKLKANCQEIYRKNEEKEQN